MNNSMAAVHETYPDCLHACSKAADRPFSELVEDMTDQPGLGRIEWSTECQ
jgi:hypothetical protein